MGRLQSAHRAVLALLAAALLAACTGGRERQTPVRPWERRLPPAPVVAGPARAVVPNAEIAVPEGWFAVSGASEHFAMLAASNDDEALDGLVRGCGAVAEGCRLHVIDQGGLDGDDAIVQVLVKWYVGGEDQSPLPRELRPAHLVPSEALLGVPVHALLARGPGGAHYEIRYWTGPDAGPEVRATALALVRSLRLVRA